jgi:hypothetical protein
VAEIKAWHAEIRADADLDTAGEAAVEEPKTPPPDALGDNVDLRSLLKLVPGAKDRIKLGAVIERALKTQVERDLALGQYVRKDEVEAGRVERIQSVRAELSNIRLLAIRLFGKPVPEMEVELEAWARSVCRKFERAE